MDAQTLKQGLNMAKMNGLLRINVELFISTLEWIPSIETCLGCLIGRGMHAINNWIFWAPHVRKIFQFFWAPHGCWVWCPGLVKSWRLKGQPLMIGGGGVEKKIECTLQGKIILNIFSFSPPPNYKWSSLEKWIDSEQTALLIWAPIYL